jgi:hypothetical protein
VIPDRPPEGWGTYVKVHHVPSPFPGREEYFSLLYLEADGRFLFIGFWRGYESSVVAGTWNLEEHEIVLRGGGTVDSRGSGRTASRGSTLRRRLTGGASWEQPGRLSMSDRT